MTKKIEFTERARDQIKKIINEDQLKKFFRITEKEAVVQGLNMILLLMIKLMKTI